LDREETNCIREIEGADAYCNRTGNRVARVTAFYREHPGVPLMGGDKTYSLYVKEESGGTVQVKAVRPWPSAKTGKINTEPIIKIYRE